MLRVARLRWRSITGGGVSLDGILLVTVLTVLLAGMVAIFVPYDDLWMVVLGWFTVELALVAGFLLLERRAARQLADLVKELQMQNEEVEPIPEEEPAQIISPDPIRPR